MPSKSQKCCCCPACTVKPGKCCRCIPETICLTFTPYGEDPCSGELDWDRTEKHFSGTVCGHDILLYFERDDYNDRCLFVLRSASLGFPEGYEHEWEVGYDIDCQTLSASVDTDDGLLEITKADRVTPSDCTGGCRCLPECICVSVARSLNGVACAQCDGKACWDEYQQAYVGTLRCSADVERDVMFAIRKKGEACADDLPDSDYDDCDPYDERCVIVFSSDEFEVDNEFHLLRACSDDFFNYAWVIERQTYEGDDERLDVSVRRAVCEEDCLERSQCPCCLKPEEFIQSPAATAVMTVLNPSGDCTGGTATDELAQTWGCGFEELAGFFGGSVTAKLYCEDEEWKFLATGRFGSGGLSQTVYGTVTTAMCPECPGDPYTGLANGYFLITGMSLPCENSGGPAPDVQFQVEVFIEAACPCLVDTP